MNGWLKKWHWFSQIGIVVKVWHASQVALPFLVAAYAAFSAYSDSLPRSQVVAFAALALGGALLAVNQLRMLLGVPIAVRSQESFEYGLRYTEVSVGHDFQSAQWGLQICIGLANSSRGPIRYQVERMDVIIGNSALPNKTFANTGGVIPLMGARIFRDAVFPPSVIAHLMGGKHEGTVEMSIIYGHADSEPTRRLIFKLGIWVDVQTTGCRIADVLQHEEDVAYYK
jgi:hypothetical protein